MAKIISFACDFYLVISLWISILWIRFQITPLTSKISPQSQLPLPISILLHCSSACFSPSVDHVFPTKALRYQWLMAMKSSFLSHSPSPKTQHLPLGSPKVWCNPARWEKEICLCWSQQTMAELTIRYAQLFSGVNVFDFSPVAAIQSKTDRFFEKTA